MAHTTDSQTAVLYARVSSKEQEREGFSIPAQLELLRAYAAKNDITILQEFVDVETAKRAGREQFGVMLDFLRAARDCRGVLVEKTDRLYRNWHDYVAVDELNLELHFVKEGMIYSAESRSSDKLTHDIKVALARNYSNNLGEETSKGMLQKARQGIWPSNAPLGYRNVQDAAGHRVIEPDPDRAPIIRRMFERYATGKYSLKDIGQMAQNEGFSYRKSGDPVPKSTVATILAKRLYTGSFDWKGTVYEGSHEPIISHELWMSVQEVLSQRRGASGARKHDFAFGRLVDCGHCGCSLVAERKKGKYTYYRCSGYKRKCPEPYVREEVLAEHFALALDHLHFDDEVMAWITQALRESYRDERQFHDEAIIRLQQETKKLQNRLEKLYEDKLDGAVDLAFFDRKSADWRQEQERVLARIAEHQNANRSYFEDGVMLLELARTAGKLFREQKPKEQRRLLDFVLSNSSWKGGDREVDLDGPGRAPMMFSLTTGR